MNKLSVLLILTFTILLNGCRDTVPVPEPVTTPVVTPTPISPVTPIISTLSFPLKSAYVSWLTTGNTKTFTLTGSGTGVCNGTGSVTIAPATTASTFESIDGFSAVTEVSASYTDCTPNTSINFFTNYYDATYAPLGIINTPLQYGIYVTPPVYPAAVMVNSIGILGTVNVYTDSTKATLSSTQSLSYIIEIDTATTAIANFITKLYTTDGVLTSTQQERYRLRETGALEIISTEVQNANGSYQKFTYN